MEKKEQVYQHIRTDTITKLKEEQFESLGLDTLTVSLDLKMNRANISRLLNQLYNEGRLIKTDSRPVFFMDRSALDLSLIHIYAPPQINKIFLVFTVVSGTIAFLLLAPTGTSTSLPSNNFSMPC